jgi:hypothetical protein
MLPDAHPCPEDLDNLRLHQSRCHGNTSGRSSKFNKKLNFLLRHRYGRQLHPSGRQGNTVRTLSLIRQDVVKNCNRPDVKVPRSGRNPYYGIYVQQKCNRSDARATLPRRGPDMVLHEARFGKSVAQLSIRTASTCVQKPPRENRISVDLSLL